MPEEKLIAVGPKVLAAITKAAAQFEERKPVTKRYLELLNMAAQHSRGKLAFKIMKDARLNLDLAPLNVCIASGWMVLLAQKGNGGDPKVKHRWVCRITAAGRGILEAHRKGEL